MNAGDSNLGPFQEQMLLNAESFLRQHGFSFLLFVFCFVLRQGFWDITLFGLNPTAVLIQPLARWDYRQEEPSPTLDKW